MASISPSGVPFIPPPPGSFQATSASNETQDGGNDPPTSADQVSHNRLQAVEDYRKATPTQAEMAKNNSNSLYAALIIIGSGAVGSGIIGYLLIKKQKPAYPARRLDSAQSRTLSAASTLEKQAPTSREGAESAFKAVAPDVSSKISNGSQPEPNPSAQRQQVLSNFNQVGKEPQLASSDAEIAAILKFKHPILIEEMAEGFRRRIARDSGDAEAIADLKDITAGIDPFGPSDAENEREIVQGIKKSQTYMSAASDSSGAISAVSQAYFNADAEYGRLEYYSKLGADFASANTIKTISRAFDALPQLMKIYTIAKKIPTSTHAAFADLEKIGLHRLSTQNEIPKTLQDEADMEKPDECAIYCVDRPTWKHPLIK